MVGLQPAQRSSSWRIATLRVASVRADLRHQEHLLAPAGERLAHALFTPRVVIPRVVHERDAAIHCGLDEPGRNRSVFWAPTCQPPSARIETWSPVEPKGRVGTSEGAMAVRTRYRRRPASRKAHLSPKCIDRSRPTR